MAGQILPDELIKKANAYFTDGLKNPALQKYVDFTTVINDGNPSVNIADLVADNLPEKVNRPGDRSPLGDINAKPLTVYDEFYKKEISLNKYDIDTGIAGTNLLAKAKAWPIGILRRKNNVVAALLAAAGTSTCFDGQYLIDTDHPAGGGAVQSNRSSSILGYDAVRAERTKMRKFKDRFGNLLGINPIQLIVGPDLEDQANEICKSVNDPTNANKVKNTLAGMEPVVFPFLASSTHWFLNDPVTPLKALIMHISKETFGITDEMDREENLYSNVKLFFVVAPGDWRAISGYIG